MLTLTDANIIASAIYRTEGSDKTIWPYGIKHHYLHTTPKQACINTIEHVSRDYNTVKIDKYFIYILADIYCPIKDDAVGNKNWKTNMVRILHL